MAKRPGQQGDPKGPRDTRVYAPTHSAAKSAGAGAKQAGRIQRASQGTSPERSTAHRGGTSPKRSNGQPAGAKRKPSSQKYATVQFAIRDEETLSRYQEQTQAREQAQRKRHTDDGAAHRKKNRRQAKSYESIHRLESIRNEEPPKPKKRREPLERRKVIHLMIAAIALIALLGAGYFVFLLEDIEVEGNETYTDSSIIALSALTPGQHMLLNSLLEAKANLESNPYIKVVEIKREFPRTIRIVMQERKEAAAISLQGVDVVIDMKGYVLSIGGGSDLTGLIRIDGMSQLGFKVNQQLGPSSDMQVQSLLLLLTNLEEFSLVDEIAGIDLSNPLRLTLQTKEGVLVILGQTNDLADKLAWMRDALPSLKAGGLTDGALDVSARGGAIYMPPGEAGDAATGGDGSDGTGEPDAPDEPGDPNEPDTPGDDLGDSLPDDGERSG